MRNTGVRGIVPKTYLIFRDLSSITEYAVVQEATAMFRCASVFVCVWLKECVCILQPEM